MEDNLNSAKKIPSGSHLRDRAIGDKHGDAEAYCPACGSPLLQEKCKMVCRSSECVYRIIFNCSEF